MLWVKLPLQRDLWAFCAIISIAALAIPPGFVSIDETIYYLGARAVAERGALGLDGSGYEQLHSEALRLVLLIDGPQGLTPQYPAGSAVVAGLLLPLLGPRAFVLLNAVAALLTLFTVRNICLSQFKSETVARIALVLLVAGTFWLEYAVGVWPHALSAFFAVQAYWFALRHLDSEGRSDRDAIFSGLFAGTGILFRLDGAFAVPAVGLILVLFAPRFVRSTLLLGAGVLPPLALASWFSFLKFGTPNPFSYGQSGGNADLASYGPFLAALCIGFGLVLLYRKVGWKADRRATFASVAILLAALLLIPATNAWLLRFWNGFVALFVDVRVVEDHRMNIQPGPGGTLTFWGLVKKALGQSMPWIGLAAILLTDRVRDSDRRVFATLLIFIATMTTPFILLSWHGGGSSNMRYFLPVVPALCVLCARLFHDLWLSVARARAFAVAGAWAAIGTGLTWTLIQPSGFAGVHQIVSIYVLIATALAAIAAGAPWRLRQMARNLAIALFACGFLMATMFAISDFSKAARWRATSHAVNQIGPDLPPKSLVIGPPDWFAVHLPGNGSLLAGRESQTRRVDQQLVVNALNADYRVFIADFEFDAALDVPPGAEPHATGYTYSGGRLIELRRLAPAPAVTTTDLRRSGLSE